MTCTIQGTYTGATPVNGELHFVPDVAAVVLPDSTLIKTRYITPVVNSVITPIALPDNVSGNPTGWTFTVQEKFTNGQLFHISPAAGTHDLKDLRPVSVNQGVPSYVGPTGPAGPPAAPPQHFVFSTPAATWTLNHGLGTYPPVVLLPSDSPTSPVYTDTTYPDANTVVLTWPTPTAGDAYIL